MNRIFKTVWSAARRCWMVVGELVKSKPGTRLKKIMLLVIAATPPAVNYAQDTSTAYMGVQSNTIGQNLCVNGGAYNLFCTAWPSTVTSVTGPSLGYMSAYNGIGQGFTWAGSSTAGLSFGGLSRAASTSQVIANAAGLTLNGDTVNLSSNTFTVNSVNGLVMSGKKITSLAAGTTSTDAVNIGQLTSVLNGLGGTGAVIDASTGAVTTPSFSLSGTAYPTVGAALSALDNGAAGPVKVTASGLTVGATAGTTTVSFAGSGGNRQLTGVANGTIASASTQAVNGGQLFTSTQNLATALGGTAAVNADGTLKAPSYALTSATGGPFNNVGSALSALDSGLGTTNSNLATTNTTLNSLQNNISSGTVGLVQQAAPGETITVGKDTDGAEISIAGTAGNRTLTGVLSGTVSDISAEAVNGSQLYGTAQSTAAALGGGVTVGGDGRLGSPAYLLSTTGVTYNNVGSALGALDTGLGTTNSNLATTNTTLNSLQNNISSGTVGLVQQAAPGETITVGKDTDGAEISIAGTAGNRTLTGVLSGTVSDISAEAVNGSQLYGTAHSAAAALGGGVTVGGDGRLGSPAYLLSTTGVTYNNVGSALSALDTGLGTTNSNVSNLSSTVNNLTTSGAPYFHANSTGTQPTATGTDAVAIGAAATASNNNDVALGANATTAAVVVTQQQNIAGTVYNFAGADPASTVSIGSAGNERTLTNLAAGRLSAGSTDAVNGSQLFASNQAIDSLATTLSSGGIGLVQQAASGEPITVGAATNGGTVDFSGTAGARTLTGVADGSIASGSSDAVNGGQLYGTSQSVATALGGTAAVNADGTLKAPSYALTSTTGGPFNNVGSALSALDTGLGTTNSNVSNLSSTVNNLTTSGAPYFHANSTGTQPTATGTDAVAIGTSASASNNNDVALGANATTAAVVVTQQANIAGTVYNFAGADPVSTVSIGSAGNERTLTNLAAGRLSAGSTDAVNGSQLFASNQAIDSLATTLSSGGIGLVQQAASGEPITVGAATNGGTVDFSGTAGARTLTGVADGSIASGSSDAVNGGQLFTTNSNVTNLTTSVSNITNGGGIRYFHANSGSAGTDAVATGSNAVAIGAGAVASSAGDVAIGYGSVDSPLIGTPSVEIANQHYNFAGDIPSSNLSVGSGTIKRTITNVAAGRLTDTSTDAVNGSQLFASNLAIDSIANTLNNGDIGLVQQVNTSDAITIGKDTGGTEVDFAGTDGNRRLTNVAAGLVASGSTDAVNGGQLFTTNEILAETTDQVTNITTKGTHYFHANSTGTDSSATGTDAVAIGQAATATNNNDVALGAGSVTATAVATPSATLARVNHNFAGANPTSTVSIGAVGSERTLTNVAAGRLSADSTDAVNGSQLFASNEAINSLSDSISNGDVGLVQQPDPNGLITVASQTGGDSVSFAGNNGSRTLIGVAAGEVSATSNQAINGAQLYSSQQSVASALGGGSTVDNNGNLTQPSYTIQGSVRNNVGDALSALDSATTSNSSDITNLMNNVNSGAIGLVRQASSSSVVTVAAATGGSEVAFAGSDGNRRLTGVANGAVSASSSEAINGSQLFATNQQVVQNTTNITDLYQTINNSGNNLVKQADSEGTVAVASATGGHSVDITGDEGTRTLTGLSDGVNDDDAVTVRQIKALQIEPRNIDQLAVNASGVASASGSNAAAVGSNARSSGANSTTLGNDSLASGASSTVVGNGAIASADNSTALGAFSSVTASNSVALGANSIASEPNTVSVGSPGNERRITNVAPGVNDTDAVNVYQLNQVQAANNQSFRNINRRVDKLDDKLTAGVASAMAMAGLPQAWQPASSLVSVAVGGYGDKSAIAVGVSTISDNGKWIAKLQGSGNNESDFGVAVGIGYQW